MTRNNKVKARIRKAQRLGITLLEAHREAFSGCRFPLRLGEHLRRKIDAGDAVPTSGQFEPQKAGAAADIERIERRAAADHKTEDAVPGGALGLGADAVPEIAVEPGGAPVPMRRDLLLDLVTLHHRSVIHFSPVSSAKASACSS